MWTWARKILFFLSYFFPSSLNVRAPGQMLTLRSPGRSVLLCAELLVGTIQSFQLLHWQLAMNLRVTPNLPIYYWLNAAQCTNFHRLLFVLLNAHLFAVYAINQFDELWGDNTRWMKLGEQMALFDLKSTFLPSANVLLRTVVKEWAAFSNCSCAST